MQYPGTQAIQIDDIQTPLPHCQEPKFKKKLNKKLLSFSRQDKTELTNNEMLKQNETKQNKKKKRKSCLKPIYRFIEKQNFCIIFKIIIKCLRTREKIRKKNEIF